MRYTPSSQSLQSAHCLAIPPKVSSEILSRGRLLDQGVLRSFAGSTDFATFSG